MFRRFTRWHITRPVRAFAPSRHRGLHILQPRSRDLGTSHSRRTAVVAATAAAVALSAVPTYRQLVMCAGQERNQAGSDGFHMPRPSAPPPDDGFQVLRPSAPPPDGTADRQQLSSDAVGLAVTNYLKGAEGRALLHDVIEQAKKEIYNSRRSEEKQLRAQARKEVENVHSLVEASAREEVRLQAERSVPLVVREDALMRRLLKEHLMEVRAEVRAAAAKELAEITNEDRYHRVNKAFLNALEKRSNEVIDNSLQRAQRPAYVALALSLAAVAVAIARPRL